jgi:non-heme chloroperoxidase
MPLRRMFLWMLAFSMTPGVSLYAQDEGLRGSAQTAVSPPYTAQFISVDKDVKLQVLDWGGTGRPLVLLAGLGYDAHEFDSFAPKLVPRYHVYAVTRRGFGASSAPKPDGENYSADRLGDDVMAVTDALKLDRPIVAGHSIAGEELSSIGSRYPEKVSGLVYLDAGYAYAYYDDHAAQGEWMFDTFALRKELDQYGSPGAPREKKAQIEHLVNVSLPRFEKDLARYKKQLLGMPENAPGPPDTPAVQINAAILKGFQIYRGVRCPVLAIFADPHALPPEDRSDPAKRASTIAEDQARTSEQADAFQAGNPSARVVRLPNASHFVFRSNEADVLREMNSFIATLL